MSMDSYVHTCVPRSFCHYCTINIVPFTEVFRHNICMNQLYNIVWLHICYIKNMYVINIPG